MSSPKQTTGKPTLDYATPSPVTTSGHARSPAVAVWIGRVLSVLVAAMLCFSAYMKFAKPPEAVQGFEHLGYSIGVAGTLGVIELSCALLYLIPQTAVLGAILIAAYLGGATASHVRIGESPAIPIVLGVVAWAALLLRERRLWSLLPIRKL